MALISTFLYILFVIAAIVLIVVILLQEGRGGGFGQALGDHAQQTFGVAASGIHKFTMWVAAIFLISAVTLHVINRTQGSRSVFDTTASPESSAPGATIQAPPAPAQGDEDK